MATWVPAPSESAIASTGTTSGNGKFSSVNAPSKQNSPATGQPNWFGAPKNTAFLNTTSGQSV